MLRGISALESAILISIVVAIGAMLGTVFLKPQTLTKTHPTMITYSALLLDKSPGDYCQQVANALYYDKIIDDPRPILIGNATSPYAVEMIVYVASAGQITGVKVTSLESGQVLTAYQYKAFLPVGRHVIFVFLNKPYKNVKVELIGAVNTCINCVVK